ncbi:MAG TPA: hypothetical protein VG166_04480 [Caulobacteraceae bacterium]|jgi:hypothetical protein|nr:hypothetical protein [Caulobacteraceae bacterium]
MAGSNVASNWIDPEPAGREATPLGRGKVVRQLAAERGEIDRFHNNESLSPEAMEQALAELKETVATLEERVAAAEAGSTSVVGAAKGLGMSMLNMGDALAKRISSLEEAAEAAEAEARAKAEADAAAALLVTPPAPARKGPNLKISLAVGGVVVAAVLAVVFLRPHPTPAPAQLLYSPAASTPSN